MPVTLSRPVVHPLPSLPPATPFFPLFSPWATWSRTGRHGNPRQSRWKLNRGTLSPSSLSLAFRSLSLSLLLSSPMCQRYSYPALSVVSKLSLAPSCSFLPPGGLSVLFLRSPSLRNPLPSPSRTLASQSPGLVSLTHARRIVMGNVQMH